VDESQANLIDGLVNKPDDELIRWTLSGQAPDGHIAALGRLVFELRCAKRNLEATTNMASATKNMVRATWAIALITLVTQIALVLMTVWK